MFTEAALAIESPTGYLIDLGWLDRYQPKEDIRKAMPNLLDDNQLKEKVREYHLRIVTVLKRRKI